MTFLRSPAFSSSLPLTQLSKISTHSNRRKAPICARSSGGGGGKRGGDDDDVETDAVISRRVFTAVIAIPGILTVVNGVNLFGGDELKDDLKRRLPLFFPEKEPVLVERASLDSRFASLFFDAYADVAVKMGILSMSELRKEETDLLNRSRSLFFQGDDERRGTEQQKYNYRLYARVHTIALRTSPQSRLEFSRRHGAVLYNRLKALCSFPDPRAARKGTADTADLLGAVDIALGKLKELGWITGSLVDNFDDGMLSEERRGELSVAGDNVFSLPCAMLIGEEEFEEISPKLTGILRVLLEDYGCRNVTTEDYYLDTVYRPDPAKFRPTQLVTQINFTV